MGTHTHWRCRRQRREGLAAGGAWTNTRDPDRRQALTCFNLDTCLYFTVSLLTREILGQFWDISLYKEYIEATLSILP